MKKKLLIRVCLIILLTVILAMGVTMTLITILNVKTVDQSLKLHAAGINDIVSRCKNIEEVNYVLGRGEDISYNTIFNSKNEIIFDNHPDKIRRDPEKEKEILSKARENGATVSLGRSHENESLMVMRCVSVANSNIDPEGILVLRCSMPFVYYNHVFVLIASIGLIIWIVFSLVAIIAVNMLLKKAILPLSDLERCMGDIVSGDFHKSNIVQCGDQQIDNIFKQLGDISDKVSASFLELQTEQLKSKFLLQSISQGIMALSKRGTIMLNNETLETIFDKEDLGGTNIDYILEGDILDNIKNSLNDGSYSIGTMHKGKNSYRVECMPVDIEDNSELSSIELLVVFTDITQEVETNLIRNEFFANASHELKTPLTAISGYSEILSMGGRDASTTKKCIDEIINNATKMKDLINDMMKLSKMDAKLDIEEETTFDLYDVCENVVEEQKMVAKNKDVDISIEGVHANIVGRKNMIKVVVENLVNNAIKYNKKNGNVVVSISKNKKYITLKVQDTGIGIPKEHQARLFERFYKVDAARTRTEESSTGLGLSIVKNIIVMHKAQINVDSKEGVGTTMTVRFSNRLNN